MRFLELERVSGRTLARNVPSERADGAPLLRAGVALTRELAARIAAAGCRCIWVEDELGTGIAPAAEFPPDAVGAAHHAIARALKAAPAALAAGRGLDPKLVRGLMDGAAEIADAVLEYPGELCPIDDMPIAIATGAWHAVRVAVLGTFLARRLLTDSGWTDHRGERRFDRIDERLSTLAFGLLVHDIAIAPVPGGWMGAESEQPPAHVSLGVSLFAAESTPAAARVAIQGHHERWDGRGYPQHKHREAIQWSARVAAIADAYDALRASGAGRVPLSVADAVASIRGGAGTQFDPALVNHFLALMAPYPVGHGVTLADGREAVTVKLPRGDHERPTVRVREGSGAVVEFVASPDATGAGTLAA